MNLVICSRCDYPKRTDEPENSPCLGHVTMADIFMPMMGQLP